VAFVILHRADHVAFRIFKKDERGDSGNMKLRHHNLSAIPGSAEYLVTTTKKVVGLALQKLPRWFHIPDTTKEIHLMLNRKRILGILVRLKGFQREIIKQLA